MALVMTLSKELGQAGTALIARMLTKELALVMEHGALAQPRVEHREPAHPKVEHREMDRPIERVHRELAQPRKPELRIRRRRKRNTKIK